MIYRLIYTPLLLIAFIVHAQNIVPNYQFDFGTGKAEKGYTKVLPTNKYSTSTGFGFSGDAEIIGVNRGGKNLLNADYCTSTKPFYFSVKVIFIIKSDL